MSIIEVEHVTKEFRLGQLRTLKQRLSDIAVRLRGGKRAVSAPFKALDDIDFKVEAGEVLGIIGHNGAGKSTLLKILAGISKPTRGRVAVRGKVAPLIEVGAGLVPDLTGRENIYVNATILGMKRAEIERKFDEIVAFAELEEFIDTPVKRYSSGMQVRLGFSIATSVKADILIVDEVLAVGDLAFQRKCFDRMEELIKRRGNTVLLVSHNIRQVERMCSRVMLLASGRMLRDSGPTEVCNEFYRLSDEKIQAGHGRFGAGPARAMSSGEIELLDIKVLGESGEETVSLSYRSACCIRMTYRVNDPVTDPVFGLGVHTTDFVYLCTTHSKKPQRRRVLPRGTYVVECIVPELPFLPGVYSVRVGIAVGETRNTAYYAENVLHIRVHDDSMNRADADVSEGVIELPTEWRLPWSGETSANASAQLEASNVSNTSGQG